MKWTNANRLHVLFFFFVFVSKTSETLKQQKRPKKILFAWLDFAFLFPLRE